MGRRRPHRGVRGLLVEVPVDQDGRGLGVDDLGALDAGEGSVELEQGHVVEAGRAEVLGGDLRHATNLARQLGVTAQRLDPHVVAESLQGLGDQGLRLLTDGFE